MNGSPTSPVSSTKPAAATSIALSSAVIDASCRVLLIPILGGLAWLFLSSFLAFLTPVKLHSPTLLAGCSWLTYGHTRPAANDTFVYGFASQVGLAVALWILCRLGRTRLIGAGAVAVASLFWNFGVALGTIGIFAGHTTGFEWLEFPRAGSAVLMASYAVLGVCALLTLNARRVRELYPSQWYILAAIFWFPWLYTTARLLLVWFPVRGVMQFAVSGWFAHGLFTLWLGSLGLAVLYYFIPKLANAPVHSRALAVLGFWTLAVFGCWGGFYRGVPLPAWMISAGIASTVILLTAFAAVVANLWLTLGGNVPSRAPLIGFFKTALIFFALSGVFAVFNATVPQLRLTLFGEGAEQLALYGFVGLALFGAVHFILPRLTGCTHDRFIAVNRWATLIGIIIFAGACLVGGMAQQNRLENGAVPFVDVMNATKPFVRVSTLGVLLLVMGNGMILFRAISLVRECCRNCGCCRFGAEAPAAFKTARAAR
jgi:cytochrome c oxidase cbb3-type subunit 1